MQRTNARRQRTRRRFAEEENAANVQLLDENALVSASMISQPMTGAKLTNMDDENGEDASKMQEAIDQIFGTVSEH